jgi:predicted DNA-binding protein
MAKDNRTPITPLRLTARHVAMLDRLSAQFQESKADVVRRAIEKLWESLGLSPILEKPKKKA